MRRVPENTRKMEKETHAPREEKTAKKARKIQVNSFFSSGTLTQT